MIFHSRVRSGKPGEEIPSLLEQALKNVVGAIRMKHGRKEWSTIVAAQSVKNADTARHKGYDVGKKVSGIKRHIMDTQGRPHAVTVMTADVTDRKELWKRSGYTGSRYPKSSLS